jgi:hypothetical protein
LANRKEERWKEERGKRKWERGGKRGKTKAERVKGKEI